LVEETNELAQLVKGEKDALSTASRIRAKYKAVIGCLEENAQDKKCR
jgi:hypothetical protein